MEMVNIITSTKSEKFTVYMHTSPSNKVYIGITCQKPEHRWNSGKSYKNNEHFWRAIQKYGWENFKHQLLYTDISRSEACEKEVELIGLYKSTDPKFGYNLSPGGEHSSPTEATREKLSAAFSGKNHPMYGKHHSEETRIKISEAHKGMPQSRETRAKRSKACMGKHSGAESPYARKIVCVETGQVFDALALAAKFVGTSKSNVSHAVRGKTKTAGGFHWKYYEE